MYLDRSTNVTVIELVQRMQQFGIIDYGIFIAILGLSSAIGLYLGIQDKQKNRLDNRRHDSIEMDYMVGGRKMKILPIAMSLAASWISATALLGMPTEMYVYGTEFVFFVISIVLAAVCVHFVFIPVYLDLKLMSSNEYLEARFNRTMRYMGALNFILTALFTMPITAYAAALVFSQGIDVHVVTTIMCLVCIFFTILGGMKAVVWTDAVQTVVIFAILILIVTKGTLQIGGFNTVWHRNYESGRIEFPSFTFDPTVRHSFFAVIIGGAFQCGQAGSISQLYIQRYVSLPSINAARKALWIFTIAVVIIFLLCFYNGLLIYATYHDCDPVTTKLAQSNDQLLPVFVMNLFQDLPGLAGLFVSGIFSASLSTLSTTLNSLSTVILVDFVKPLTTKPLSQFTTNVIMRFVVLISGLICVGLVLLVEKFGAILQFKMTVTSCTTGPLFGIFLIGLLLPWINSTSALFGGVFSFIVMLWITWTGQMAILNKEIVFSRKPTATHGCTYNYTTVTSNSIIGVNPVETKMYHVSYLWYVFIGTTVTIVVSGLASFVFGWQNPYDVNPVLWAPFIRKYFKSEDHLKGGIKKRNNNVSIKETKYAFSSLSKL